MKKKSDLTPQQIVRATPKNLNINTMKHKLALEALLAADGNKKEAAKLLGIDRNTIAIWLKVYGF
ncbi:helix-turn-helix domain-containing protein [Variovorax sp. J22R193]|uniref:helix-turn-helix domain-containing protein n=1 Tax=Variovorax fucosicus TaxID=3053517 RepID=UPI0025759209|nr:helix-turn-helix domain-containing protein [Variovorax sp. J22R193]MDM0042164.1 helix-turn-helix domain-containing protein [Variovorax sp. J22R193]